jgi:hypothetical protein
MFIILRVKWAAADIKLEAEYLNLRGDTFH